MSFNNKALTINCLGTARILPPSILIDIQQDAMLHSLFYLETALHVSGVTTTHHQERKQLYLQHLVFVTPLLLPAAIVEELELVCVCCTQHTQTSSNSSTIAGTGLRVL